MRSIEEDLKMKKELINNIEAPEELEDRLRKALDSAGAKGEKPMRKKHWLMRHKTAAAILIFIMFFGLYNQDALAYYSKKIIGYDEVIYGSLKDINEMGKGQVINKSYKFKDGTEVILDGIVMDENKLYVMCRVIGEKQNKINKIMPGELKGSFKIYKGGADRGKVNDSGTEIKWVAEYEPPKFYERNLTLGFANPTSNGADAEFGEIKFKLDRSKAIKRTVKANIDKAVEFNGIQYKFTTLTATPMSTVLKGEIIAKTEEGEKLLNPAKSDEGRYIHIEVLETYEKDGKLVTEEIDEVGNNLNGNGDKKEFTFDFSGVKPGVRALTLNIVKIEDMRPIDKSININSETKNLRVVPETDELIIKEVKVLDGDTVVTFTGPKDVAFDTALMVDGRQLSNVSGFPKLTYGEDGTFEKVYRFAGSGSNMQLMFKALSHETYINKQITIYEEK